MEIITIKPGKFVSGVLKLIFGIGKK